MTTILILHLCNCVYLSLFLYLSHVNGAEWNKSSVLCLVLPSPQWPAWGQKVSLRSKRFRATSSRKLEREQKKQEWWEWPFFFFRSRSNFRAITRMETLATQANRSGEVTVSGGSTVYLFIYLFIYLFTHSSTYERLSTLPGSIALQGGVKMNHSLSWS